MSHSQPKLPRIAGYQLIERIGGGGFSIVYKAVNFDEHRVAACKVIALTSETTAQNRKSLDKEMRVHAAMKHVHVLEFISAAVVEHDSAANANTKYFPGFYMLLELASGGDLFDKIAPDVGLEEDVAHYYFTQLIAGVTRAWQDYIHGQGVCHRDLKPENLLLDAAGRLKISDFGLCSVFRHKESGKERMLTDRCGSLPYVAPELNSDHPYRAEPIDIWGAGIILFTLLCGNTPWDEPTGNSREFRRYVRGEVFEEAPWNKLDDSVLSLLKGSLALEPSERFTVADITAHPWVSRPSQVAAAGHSVLAERLTQSLRQAGDMGVIDPHNAAGQESDSDAEIASQFTQSLLLFSQTQRGNRYTPQLTRFYTNQPAQALMSLVVDAMGQLSIKSKPYPPEEDEPERLRLRIGGYDRRKEMFKGWIEIEPFAYQGVEGSFCVMSRDQGNPLSWRQLWKAVIQSPNVEPHVLKRR